MGRSRLPVLPMTGSERRAAAGLAGIFALRMLGLFLILPVFALYAQGMTGATPLLIGIAVGAYGLTQAVLQIPFGMLSDRIGRKPVIFGGLVLFALGSLVAALAEDIGGVIAGRVLQGSGAIAAAVMALAADLTREEVRTHAMAGIGVSIGVAFALALVLGPVLGHWIGLVGIFWLTAGLAVGGMLILALVVPTPDRSSVHRDAQPVASQFGRVLKARELVRLDLGVLILHMMMTSLFLVVPLSLEGQGLDAAHHWWVYLPVLLLSMVAMVPFIIQAEGKGRMKPVFLGAVLALALTLAGLYLLDVGLWWLAFFLFLFFTAFNLLEAALPSLISKLAPADAKGTAMGVFATSQFAGAFCGGLLGGWVHQAYGMDAVFLFCAAMAVVWFLVAQSMVNPRPVSSQVVRIRAGTEAEGADLQHRLLEIPGVEEAVVAMDEGLAYLKVDKRRLDWAELKNHTLRSG
ncbi:MFS transporter [Candidatus Thiosymbion oneisti]|uniref:MFS transporter n=1 Tax=Candidatus Thiosymbion oneisti TaxID=589554 RepID=UPI000ACB622C|nr:MFS transporter [Candidatus Thiosymbion oneisti]